MDGSRPGDLRNQKLYNFQFELRTWLQLGPKVAWRTTSRESGREWREDGHESGHECDVGVGMKVGTNVL